MKYFTQTTKMQNYGKLYRFLIIAMMMLTSGMAWAQWSPNITSAETYYIKTYLDPDTNEPELANSDYGTYKFQYRKSSDTNWSPEQSYIQNFVVDCTSESAVVKLVFLTTHPVGFSNATYYSINHQGAFMVHQGILQMELGSKTIDGTTYTYSSTVTLKRVGGFNNTQNQSCPFVIYGRNDNDEGAATRRQLIIKGNPPTLEQIQNTVSSNNYDDLGYNPTKVWQDTCTFLSTNQFVIDGGYTFSNASWDESTGALSVSGSGPQAKRSLFRLQTGTLELTNVTIQNASNNDNNSGIHLMTNYGANRNVALKMTHCWMDHLYAPNYPGLGIQVQIGRGNNSVGTVEINRCKFSNIFDADGADAAIRSVSSSTASLSVDSCVIWRNFGGGIRWQSLIAPAAQISNTVINGNFNKVSGGGIFAKAGIALSNCKITNNTSMNNGGGINYITYDEGSTQGTNVAGYVYPKSLNLAMDATTVIDGNKAINGYGGGICINGGFIYLGNNTGPICYEYDDEGNNPKTFMISMNQNGATISNNEAEKDGGGVYIYRNANAFFYGLQCNLTYGTISGNKTISGYGGGVAINSPSTPTIDPKIPSDIASRLVPQDVTVTVGKAGETANKISIENNTAATYGGGIYVEAYPIPYNGVTSEVNTTVYDYSEIKGNTGTSYGGGLYVKRGTVNVTQSGSKKPLIQGNKANTNHGGGIYLDEGSININGGILDGNKAKAHGGGIYNNNGSISLSNNSLVRGNEAGTYNSGTYGNGGGIYTQFGTINIANSSVQGNKCQKFGGGIYTNSGNITLTNATIGGDNTANEGNQTVHAQGDGGGIYTENGAINMTNSSVQGNTAKRDGGGVYVKTNTVTMLSCTVGGNEAKFGNEAKSGNGGGIYVGTGDVLINHFETGTESPSNISYNKAKNHGGGIYNQNGRVVAYGSFSGETDYPIQITHNEATTGSGGGIFCMGNAGNSEYDIRLRRINVSNNKALGSADPESEINLGCGGGVYLDKGKVSIINGTIGNNEANVGGGGIYTREGDIDINPTRDERHASSITNNTAGLNGGGLNTHSGKVRIFGNNKGQRIIIRGNQATTGSGGGVFCYGTSINTEYITMRHADLLSNKALNGGGTQTVLGDEVVSGCGGGMYLQKGRIHITDVNIQNNYAKRNGGGINNHEGNIDVDGCYIGSSKSTSGDHYYNGSAGNNDTDRGNKADNSGGGIYTNKGDINIEDYIENAGSLFREESKVSFNEAHANGGGIDTHQGTIYINNSKLDDQIEISYNKANRGGGLYANAGTIIAYNANINNNTAETNGGGINNHSGNIMIYGGTLTNNRADKGHGGGAYTNVGDIDIYPFPETSTDLRQGTMIFNNFALKNGGAFNNHTGRVDARYATLFNNTASQGNGGGIYCEGPHTDATGFTIRLLGSQLVQNKTRGQDGTAAEPTGRGGGIYLKYGDIYAHDTWIFQNSANRHGGGINNHEGTILVYGCNIENNTAVEGKGGGIYANEGQIHTGPCFNGTVSQSTVIKNNVANENGGGINNHKGNITINGDYIAYNEAVKGDGGGVYIANGIINMFGGTIANNKADQGKGGGVYSGGGQYNIQKREDKPKPVVTILDADISRDGDNLVATIHYHVVDKGNNNGTSPAHGFYWGTSVPETPTGTPNYTYSQGNSQQSNISYTGSVCDGSASGYKVVIRSGITAGQTYEVKAFYSYRAAGETVYGFSEKATFTAYSDAPTVVTGSVTNLVRMDGSTTQYQVEVNGKVHDHGSSALTAKGIQWKTTTGNYTSVASTEELDFFTVTLNNLTPNTEYTVRAYATNSSGTSYGDEVTFTTPKNVPDMGNNNVVVTAVTDQSAHFSFTMPAGTTFGTGGITSYGFVWSTDNNPALSEGQTITGTLETGTKFTATDTRLSPATCYYVRAFASTTSTEIIQQNMDQYAITTPKQFYTTSADGSPVVRAIRITDITQNSATIICKIYNGYTAGTTYGVHVDNLAPNYFPSDNYQSSDSTYSVTLGDLTAGMTYYLKAYATNNGGATYSYGNGYNFTALPITLPNVVVKEIQYDENNHSTVTVVCKIESTGGGTISDGGYGIIYGQGTATGTTKYGSNLSNGQFSVIINDLTAHQDYWVRAFATNSAGTHTCAKVNFSTNFDKPSVTLAQIGNVSFNPNPTGTPTNSAEGWYRVTPHSANEEDKVKTYGVCWSTFRNPTRTNSDVANTHFTDDSGADITGSEAVDCSTNMVQRYPNTKYYVRAYASTEEPADDPTNNTYSLANIKYSNEKSFVTLPDMQTTGVVATTHNTATLGGKINSRDTEHHLRYYGICWGSDANPEKGTGNYVEHAITAPNSSTFSYSLEATGLTVNTTYHYRAYCINENGESGSYPNVVGNIAYGPDATFTTRQFSVSLSADPTEGGSVNGSYESLENNSYKATATANAGYTFANWTENGTSVSTNVNYTFNVTSDKTLVANFTPKQYTITTTANPSTGGTTAGGGNVIYNTTVTLTATPSEGYKFVSWALNGEVVSTDAEYTFTYNIAGNATFVANFEPVSRGSSQSNNRPRDIYPAPAREPWDWDDDEWAETVCTPSPKQDSTNNTLPDSIAMLIKQRQNRDVIQPSTNPSVDHNAAKEGGGIYIANGGKILFSSGSINLNKALVNGGGIYLEQGSIMHMKNICEVNGNHTPDFSLTEDANGNPVIVGGGAGIYLDGKLYLGNKIDDAKGTHRLTVDKNYAMTRFTETDYNNNVYNDSYYHFRNNVFLPYTTNKQADSYFDAYSDFDANATASTPDNSKTNVIALLSDISNNGNTNYSHIGFSVTKGKIPVIATAKKEDQDLDNLNFLEYGIYEYGNGNQQNTEEWMNTITGRMNSINAANASIFDDARAYIAIHAKQDDKPFRNDFIYLWDCWTTPIVKYDPALYDMYGHRLTDSQGTPITDNSHYTKETITTDGVTKELWHIKDEKGLAWFSANVNRLNGSNNENYSTLEAVLEADLDMTEYLWVPIGSVRQVNNDINTIFRDLDNTTDNDKLGYRGTFNGQGHVIKGIDCRYISSLVKYGLFGNLEEGANVYNTFVDASLFRTNDASKPYYVGGIAGLVEEGATISNSEARATIDVTLAKKATSYVGGLVGKAEGTTTKPTVIHSSMAMPVIKGSVRYVGGLVGQLEANCNLLNSFSNPKFPNASYQDTCWLSCHYVDQNQSWVAGNTANIYFGGLVGENKGLVENCYSRLQGDEPKNSSNQSIFGWFAGTNNANIKYCYAPRVADESSYDYASFNYVGNPGTGPTITEPDNYGTTLRYSGKYGFKHRDHQMKKGNTTYEKALPTGKASANDTLVGGLQFTLNRWVNAKNTTTNTYSTWTRTMASPINDDYPVLMLTKKNDSENFNSVGSKDGIYMVYEDNINDMWAESGKDFKSCNTAGSNAAMYLYNVQPGTPPADVTISGNDKVRLYIHEDVGITQSQNSVLHARVGVTIKNTRKGANDYTDDPNWHLFSSAINEVPMGIRYRTAEDVTPMNIAIDGYGSSTYKELIVDKAAPSGQTDPYHPESVWGNRDYFDPPKTEWYQSDDNNQTATYAPNKVGYFPTDTPYGTWRPTNGGQSAADADVGGFFDLFDYSEKYYHWMNYKREGTNAIQDHWHYDKDAQDKNHYRISGYRNDVTMLAGKGYLMALSGESMMMADGTLNTGEITKSVTKTPTGENLPPHGHGSYAYDEPYRSLNIAGNPYQSYLDFHEFVFNTEANNSDLLFSENETTYSYATRSADGKTYQYFTTTQSRNPATAGPYLHPHQGFFVKVKKGGKLKFNNDMRATSAENSHFRYEQIDYPLVNLFCYDANGKRDYTTVEISRPEAGGGHKMENLCMSDAQIYAHYNDDNYQILFAPEGVNVVPVRCKVIEDGYFTMRWSTYHGDFSYLHLIDNLTGADVDCLTTDEYKFEGKASDYNSRFKLVFDCTGIDEPETPEPDEGPTVFAFQMGNELIVNGEGVLQMFDLNGRCLMTKQAVGQQSSVSLPQVAAGMYLLRLTSNKQVRVQKMVIK